jgi:hypothetical protein
MRPDRGVASSRLAPVGVGRHVGVISHPGRCAAAAVLAIAAGACSGDDEQVASSTTESVEASGDDQHVEAHDFVTRPDLTPPQIDVTVSESTTPGYLFLAPKQVDAQPGPLIVDDDGDVVWASPVDAKHAAADFRVQIYRGEPVLTWYEGTSSDGYGSGEFVIADESYEEIARVRAGNGLDGDLHEFQLTDEGTALILAYERAEADLTSVGGPADGFVLDNHVQEIDVATGEVLLDWNAGDHVDIADTGRELVDDAAATEEEQDEDGTAEHPFDWFHVNSVSEDGDDALLVSARNTHAIYSIDRATGDLRWTLGSPSSDFDLDDETSFHWQHDARRLPDGTLSLFDNEAGPPMADESRGLILELDEEAGEATVARELVHPDGVLASSQGNLQMLEDGGAVVGWGSEGRVTEFGPDGTVLFDATWAPADSYRVYRLLWTGRPATTPDVVARPLEESDAGAGEDDEVDVGDVEVFVSWNGATEVAEWRITDADAADGEAPLATVPRSGFETRVVVGDVDTVVVEALDADGQVLGTSSPTPVEG